MRLCSVCRNQTRKVWHGITQTRMTRRATEAALSREGALIRIFDAPRRAFSEGPCGVLDAFGINRGKPPAPIASATP